VTSGMRRLRKTLTYLLTVVLSSYLIAMIPMASETLLST